MSSRPTAVLYLEKIPQPTGSGADLRFYSNVRGYLDAGFQVHVVVLSSHHATGAVPRELSTARFDRIDLATNSPGLINRLAFRVGSAGHQAFSYFFPHVSQVLRAVTDSAGRHPEAIHHFEGESLASAIPFLAGLRTVWSLHDVPSVTSRAVREIDADLGRSSASERAATREFRFLSRAERRIAHKATHIFAISDLDRQMIQRDWGMRHISTLPMSVADETWVRRPAWLRNGVLRLLHLGRTAHLPSFRSLQFLLGSVFPLLGDDVRRRIRLMIVGTNDGDDPRSAHIRELASPYPDTVEFRGFVEDIRPLYEEADVQIVAATAATGLRTRIIESFAWGLPVISTPVAASGILGLEPGRNVLIANEPPDVAEILDRLLRSTEALAALAAAARRTYISCHSRTAVSEEILRVFGD